ncbi:hypothetical protein ADIWIN_1542 [Winogradskyella psychrotolerans RS-3]|uniref:Uncharacterized protein n=1 Tax=Winogradskyella psychrotolerans RS-3 TaxID=641526 RepID=S7VVT4_9FLAO|nr:hypothetical protein ADIWIN_1542 [Winogradskyella psychrotolerans RS-3]
MSRLRWLKLKPGTKQSQTHNSITNPNTKALKDKLEFLGEISTLKVIAFSLNFKITLRFKMEGVSNSVVIPLTLR